MALTLVDLADERHELDVNRWTWRPMLELLARSGILDAERLEMMAYNGTGVAVNADEARHLAAWVRLHVVPQLPPGTRLLADGSTASTPDDGTFYRTPETMAQNYSISADWLRAWCVFAERCGGFTVL